MPAILDLVFKGFSIIHLTEHNYKLTLLSIQNHFVVAIQPLDST